MEDLLGNLMAYETKMKKKDTPKPKTRKSLAFKVTSDSEVSSDEEDLIILFKKFSKFCREKKEKKEKEKENPRRCYHYNNKGHLQIECPLLKKEKEKKYKKVFQATWDNSSLQEEGEDPEKKDKITCIGFMAMASDSITTTATMR
jgi:hypothetical protein